MAGRWWVAAVRPRAPTVRQAWALPKGLIDEGETPAETAVRETYEETGSAPRVGQQARRRPLRLHWDGERIFKIVSFFLLRAVGGRLGALPAGMEIEVAEARWLPLDGRAAPPRVPGRTRDGRCARGARRGAPPKSDHRLAARGDVRAQLLLAGRRRPAAHRPQDRDDPARRQVGEVQEGNDRHRPRRCPLRTAREDLRRGDRQGRGQAARRALAARDRARQPGDPPRRRVRRLALAALQPRGLPGRHRDGDPLLADRRHHVLRGGTHGSPTAPPSRIDIPAEPPGRPAGLRPQPQRIDRPDTCPACGLPPKSCGRATSRCRTPRTPPGTPRRSGRRRPGSGARSSPAHCGHDAGSSSRAPRSSAACDRTTRQKATQSPSVRRRSSWIQFRFGASSPAGNSSHAAPATTRFAPPGGR